MMLYRKWALERLPAGLRRSEPHPTNGANAREAVLVAAADSVGMSRPRGSKAIRPLPASGGTSARPGCDVSVPRLTRRGIASFMS